MPDSFPDQSSSQRSSPQQPEADWAAWARSLRYFRICRSRGGIADDNGDSVLAAFAIADEQDMIQTLQQLGIPAERLFPDDRVAEPGVSYTGEDWAKFVTPIMGHPAYKQPGHTIVAGRKAFVWVYPDKLEISVLDPEHPYDVTEVAVQAARTIETILPPLAHKLIDPPRDANLCS